MGLFGSLRARAVAGVSILAIALIAFGASPLGAALSDAAGSEALQTTVKKTEEKQADEQEAPDDEDSSEDEGSKADAQKAEGKKGAAADSSKNSEAAESSQSADASGKASAAEQPAQSQQPAASSSQGQDAGSASSGGASSGGATEKATDAGQAADPSGGTKVDETQLTPSEPTTFEVNVTIDATPAGGDVIYRVVTLETGQTAYDALVATGANINARGTIYGIYISAINGLAEMDYGSKSGWVYAVDGVQPNVACSSTIMHAGQTLVWTYVNVEP